MAELIQAFATVPRPGPGPRFEVDAQNRIELSGWTKDDASPEPQRVGLNPEIREAAEDLVAALAGTNAHAELLAEAQRYLAAVSDECLTIDRLYARGIRLENADFVLATAIAAGERPALPGSAKEALQSILHLHAAAVMTDLRGARLVAAAEAYRRPSGATSDAQSAARDLAAGMAQAGGLFGPAATTAMSEAAETLGTGPNPERSTQVSAGMIDSLLRTVASLPGLATSGIIARCAWDILKDTAVVGAGLHAATAGLDQAFAFLLDQAPNLQTLAAALGGDLAWLHTIAKQLVTLWERRASRRR